MNKETTKYVPEELESKIDIDFDALLKELNALREAPQLNETETNELVFKLHEQFPNKEIALEKESDVLMRVVERIEIECGDAGHFNFFGAAMDLVEINPSNTEFVEHKALKGEFAAYDHKNGIIVLTRDVMQGMAPVAILENLATLGYSQSIRALHHELLHSKQFRSSEEENKIIEDLVKTHSFYGVMVQIKRLLGPYMRAHDVLKEVHSYQGEQKFGGEFDTTADLVGILKGEAYGYKKTKDTDRIIIASQDIKRLYAFELSDDEIGVLVKEARWDKKRRCYDLIEDKVKELTETKGLDEEDVDNLVLADDIKRKIYIQKVKLIAQDELKKAVESLK